MYSKGVYLLAFLIAVVGNWIPSLRDASTLTALGFIALGKLYEEEK